MGTPTHRYTLRDLPFAAKLVVTAFLLSVGLGYVSALVQLHFRGGSRPGEAMPGARDVVARFSGMDLETWWKNREFTGRPAPPPDAGEETDETPVIGAGAGGDVPLAVGAANNQRVLVAEIIKARCAACHSPDTEAQDPELTDYDKIEKELLKPKTKGESLLVRILTAPPETSWGKENMAPAFTTKSEEWKGLKRDPGLKTKLDKLAPLRESERLAVVAWAKAGGKKEDYENGFPLPEELKGRPFEDGMVKTVAGDPTTTAKVEAEKPKRTPKKKPLDPHELACKKQMSVESLTQSTHAHLLSFCVLFGATGLIFAFSSYPGWLRGLLAPVVLVAQVADVSCWWLARIDGPGPFFALAIIGTGAVVGVGLGLQIVLGVFNLYGVKGKVVVAVLLLAGFGLLAGLAGPAFRGRLAEEAKDAAPPAPVTPTDTPKPAEKAEAPLKPAVVAEKPPAEAPKTMAKIEE